MILKINSTRGHTGSLLVVIMDVPYPALPYTGCTLAIHRFKIIPWTRYSILY